MYLTDFSHKLFKKQLTELPEEKILISTINAYSFNILQKDRPFRRALLKSSLILPDGISIVLAMRFLSGIRLKKIAGADLLKWELCRLQAMKGKCFFLGSKNSTLEMIYERAKKEYPDVKVNYYQPHFKSRFTADDNLAMLQAVNSVSPDVLFIGMTAPKQEKWAIGHFNELKANHVCCIGAAFDFYAGTIKRAPNWMIRIGLEWFYRLIREPRRNWKRYMVGNTIFIGLILKEKIRLVFFPKKSAKKHPAGSEICVQQPLK